jgi:hypothetical protein
LKLLNNRKGQVRVIEAFLASMMLLACLTFIPAATTQKTSSDNLTGKAQTVLLSLDSDGTLSHLVTQKDWTALSQSLGAALPLTVWYNLTVYDANMHVLNPYSICNGGAVSSNIASVTYVCASQNSTFAVYVLQLQLAVMD